MTGAIDVEAKIAASQGRALAAVEPSQDQLAAGRDHGQVRARSTTGSSGGRWPGASREWSGTRRAAESVRNRQTRGDQNQTDPSVRPRDFHDTRSCRLAIGCRAVRPIGGSAILVRENETMAFRLRPAEGHGVEGDPSIAFSSDQFDSIGGRTLASWLTRLAASVARRRSEYFASGAECVSST